MGTSEDGCGEFGDVVAWVLFAWSRGKLGVGRLFVFCVHIDCSLIFEIVSVRRK